MNVAFFSMKDLQEEVRAELHSAAIRVLDSGRYVQGPEVAAFEAGFASHCGVSHAIAVNSGTSALHLALLAAGVQPGDEVITVPLTFVATASAIQYAGARVVFVDVEPDFYTMNPALLEKSITARTRAIIPVHLYGQPADMNPILAIAQRHGIAVIEDACQAHGARYSNRPIGSLGQLACFSFYPSKNLGGCGEGGAVVTTDPEYARKIRMLRDWGQEGKYRHVLKGFNYRMDELQAALLSVKLPHLSSWNESRRHSADLYLQELDGSTAIIPQERLGSQHVYHVYAARFENRTTVKKTLLEAGIETGIHYPDPVHLMPAFADLGYSLGDFPISERIAKEELSLPMFPGLNPDAIRYIAGVLKS